MQRKRLRRELTRINGNAGDGFSPWNAPMLDFLEEKDRKHHRRQAAHLEKKGNPKALARMVQVENDTDKLNALHHCSQLIEERKKRRLIRLKNMGIKQTGGPKTWKFRWHREEFDKINKLNSEFARVINRIGAEVETISQAYIPEKKDLTLKLEELCLTVQTFIEHSKNAGKKRKEWVRVMEEAIVLCRMIRELFNNVDFVLNPGIAPLLLGYEIRLWKKNEGRCERLLQELTGTAREPSDN